MSSSWRRWEPCTAPRSYKLCAQVTITWYGCEWRVEDDDGKDWIFSSVPRADAGCEDDADATVRAGTRDTVTPYNNTQNALKTLQQNTTRFERFTALHKMPWTP